MGSIYYAALAMAAAAAATMLTIRITRLKNAGAPVPRLLSVERYLCCAGVGAVGLLALESVIR